MCTLLTSALLMSVLVRDRVPVAFFVLGPATSGVPRELIRQRADAMLRVRTRLEVVPIDALGIPRGKLEACGADTNLACWVGAIGREEAPPFLMVVTVHQGERGRIAVLVIDLDRAVRAYDHVSTTDEDWKERVEALMYQDAVHSDFAELDASDATALDSFFAKLFDTKLRGLLESAQHWRETGSLEVETEQAGLTIDIDGEDAGTTAAGRTVVDGVPIGERTVRLEDPNGLYQHDAIALTVERGRAAHLAPVLSAGPSAAPAIRAVTLWTGVATAAAGVALVIYAFVAPEQGYDLRVCPGGDCPDSDRRFATFSGDPGGVPIAPIAFGLLGAGLGWSLGTLIGEDYELPWIAWITGAVLGGATLATAWIAN